MVMEMVVMVVVVEVLYLEETYQMFLTLLVIGNLLVNIQAEIVLMLDLF